MMSISLDECRRALGAGTVVLWLAIGGTLGVSAVVVLPAGLEAQARSRGQQQRGSSARSSGQSRPDRKSVV